MFPFGSLISQVSLIILAAAYMLYFGAYLLNKSKENITENQPEPKEKSVITNPVSAAGTFYYNGTSEVIQNASVPEESIVKYARSYIKVRYFDPDKKTSSSNISFNLFSRPPPVQA
jgi:hypothetical protein